MIDGKKILGPYYSNSILFTEFYRYSLVGRNEYGIWASTNVHVAGRLIFKRFGGSGKYFETEKAAKEDLDKYLINAGYILIDDEEKFERLKVLL